MQDLGITVPTIVRAGLRGAHARRVDGRWTSPWKHSLATRHAIESALRRREARSEIDIVLQVQDLCRFERPYLVFQDLSYDVLLDVLNEEGLLSHFPGLSRRAILRLRDRQRHIYDGAAGVLAMSRWFADHLVDRTGLSPDKVHVVNPGASALQSSGAPSQRVERRLSGPRRRLLLVGKDFETKGGPQVVAAVAALRSELDPTISLTVVGPQTWPMPGEPPEGVEFLGRLPVARLSALYEEHDVFVMPSRFEGFGIALVEALAHGLPCVARDVFAMPEIIRDGHNGALVRSDTPEELAKVIAAVLSDDRMFSTVASEAGDVRAHFSWDRAARETLAIAADVR